jgi:DNA processing protein
MPVGRTAVDWLAACFAPTLTARQRQALVEATGPGVPWATRATCDSARRIGTDVPAALARGAHDPRVASTLAWLAADDQHLLSIDDEAYPGALRELADPPLVLYAKGDLALLGRPAIAVVGSRNPSALGEQTAEAFARALAQAGLTVVSGLALGIDAAAHRGALDGLASTVAVVGTGLDIVYPARNRELAHRIAAQGCLVSEFHLGTPARAEHFPRRNRILSGLSMGCLVVEANPRSGSLITARLAAEQGRDVFAIPGSIHSPLSKGCHALIKQGAKLTESAGDILEELADRLGGAGATLTAPAPAAADATPLPTLSAAQRRLLATVPYDPISLDALSSQLGWSAAEVSAGLLELELSGLIARTGHAACQRIAAATVAGVRGESGH